MIHAATVLLAWGVFAFGAVYPWAAVPLAAAVTAVAAWQWRPGRARFPRSVVVAAALVTGAVAVQLIPLPVDVVRTVSPGAMNFLSVFDVAVANGFVRWHSLSVDPALTAQALGYFVLCVAWAGACAAALSRGLSVRLLARNIAIIATVLAIVGLAQKATFNDKLLWFWTPEHYAWNGFGPFVNRNHFAGWMLLALCLTLGLARGYVSRAGLTVAPTWRDRLLALGSPAAAPVLVTSAAAVVMACALVWTMSRSGIIATAVAVCVLIVAAAWRSGGWTQRWMAAGYGVCLLMGVAAWRGTDTLASWYGNTGTWRWRLQLWQDTLPLLQEHWLAGSGLNTYRRLMLVHPRSDMTVLPLQAHNDYLQLGVEGGLLVGIPVLILAVAVGAMIVRALRMPQDDLTWWVRVGGAAGLCGMAVQELSEFSLQIPGVALLYATCVALAVHHPAAAHARSESRSRRGHATRSDAGRVSLHPAA
jgi:O-antigen ligase